ncbi:MAG: OadG family protein [Clostridia bacterium]|nr:OadG family protein [Clostridia bacterium]
MVDKGAVILQGLAVTIEGLAIVFLILVIIMLVIKAMELFTMKKEAPVAESEAAPAEHEQPVTEVVFSEDDKELIAVLTAAVCASLGGSKKYVVKSYKRVGAWGAASLRETLENKI